MAEKPQFEGLKAATETTKQIITLSTGVVTITVTFFDKFGPAAEDGTSTLTWTLIVAWGLYGMAILLGLVTMGAITGTLDSLDRKSNGQAMTPVQTAAAEGMSMGRNVRLPALGMSACFFLAMVLTIWSGLSLG
jgi:hypothetical protein